jgi:hypothetical protein
VIVNSQLHIQLPGYKGPQKVSLSRLISFLPAKYIKSSSKESIASHRSTGIFEEKEVKEKSTNISVW